MFRLTTKRGTYIYESDNAFCLMVASGIAGAMALTDADLNNEQVHDALERAIKSAYDNPNVTIDVVDEAIWQTEFGYQINEETPSHIKIIAMHAIADHFDDFYSEEE